MLRTTAARWRYRLIEQVVLPRFSNLSVNRRFWDRYARAWDARDPYLDVDHEGADREAYIAENIGVLGDEWGTPTDVATVLEDFVYPSLQPVHTVVEIGVGGGRIAAAVAPRVSKLYGFDISREMLKRARQAVPANVELVLLHSPELPRDLSGSIDFAYASTSSCTSTCTRSGATSSSSTTCSSLAGARSSIPRICERHRAGTASCSSGDTTSVGTTS